MTSNEDKTPKDFTNSNVKISFENMQEVKIQNQQVEVIDEESSGEESVER
jgi:hypothetical protein